MPNGEVCCLMMVCCPPERARAAMSRTLAKDWAVDEYTANRYADYIFEHFDLAPKGTLQPFKDAIVAQIKSHEK